MESEGLKPRSEPAESTGCGQPLATPVPDVRELAAKLIADQFCDEAYYVSWERLPERNRDYYRAFADEFLAAVTPVIRRQERERVAEEIRAHADRHAPLAGHGVPAPLRWHLHIAARIAAGPMTIEEAAQAFAAAIARSHSTQPTEEETTNG